MKLLKPESKSYGGTLRQKRKGRGARPISTKDSTHLILKSSKAVGQWSFRQKKNAERVERIIAKFAKKYQIKIESIANVGNHLHLHIQILFRRFYKPFIRAITSAIAMAITDVSRWNKINIKFWDYRPFTRVVRGWKAVLTMRDYMMINQLEGLGTTRIEARFIVANRRRSFGYASG